jgi:hypothetical protein
MKAYSIKADKEDLYPILTAMSGITISEGSLHREKAFGGKRGLTLIIQGLYFEDFTKTCSKEPASRSV